MPENARRGWHYGNADANKPMAHTVKTVAAMSGVSIRTLHFYDEVGLLKPAYVGANGYRFYEEAQLLRLQQILFYRKLGFKLERIKKVLDQPNFDKVRALESHRKVLRKDLAHTRLLIKTIEKTLEHLKGTKKMKAEELFKGFDPEQQARHEKYLVNRFGQKMEGSIKQSKDRLKGWSKSDWEKAGVDFDRICRDLVAAIDEELPTNAPEVQELIRRHHSWLSRFWTPTRESYAGHSQLLVDSDLRKAYEAYDKRLPVYAAEAMRTFAEAHLS
jgi:DNA-binding transcriptional MerR regulator